MPTHHNSARPLTHPRTATGSVLGAGYPSNRFGLRVLEMLGHDQPRDSHVHGAPHARAELSAQLMQYERGVCARRTATKYRNTTTATRYPAGLRAALACSVANMVAVAGSSGRRGSI